MSAIQDHPRRSTQDCKECDKDGMISNKRLSQLDLESEIQKYL